MVLAFAAYTAVAILVAALAIVLFVRKNVEDNTVDKVASRTQLTAAGIVPTYFEPADFERPVRGARLRRLDADVKRHLLRDGALRVKVYDREGRVVYSDDHSLIGDRSDHRDEIEQVLGGAVLTETSTLNKEGGVGENVDVFESYALVRFPGERRPAGVFELYVDRAVAAGSVREQAVPMTIALLLVMLGLYLALLPILRRTTRALAFSNRELRRRAVDLQVNLVQRAEIEDRLRQTIKELERSEQLLTTSREETILRLSMAVESRHSETGSHIERMGRYCALVASKLGWDDERCELLRIASPLHDVGKIAIPDNILQKPGALTADERTAMERHAAIGHTVLAGSDSELLELAAKIALTHHERWDGAGYPNGLSGTNIPIEGRIAAIADVFDALTSDRVYREAMPVEAALSIMTDGRGSHFDPEILDVFFASIDEVLAIRDGKQHVPELDDASTHRRPRHAALGRRGPRIEASATRKGGSAGPGGEPDDNRRSVVG